MPASGRPADATSGAALAGLVAAAAALAASALTSWLVLRAGCERVARGGRVDAGSAGAPSAGGIVRDPRTGRSIRTAQASVDAAKLGSLASVDFSPPAALTPATATTMTSEGKRKPTRGGPGREQGEGGGFS